jgi:hypothetical protein
MTFLLVEACYLEPGSGCPLPADWLWYHSTRRRSSTWSCQRHREAGGPRRDYQHLGVVDLIRKAKSNSTWASQHAGEAKLQPTTTHRWTTTTRRQLLSVIKLLLKATRPIGIVANRRSKLQPTTTHRKNAVTTRMIALRRSGHYRQATRLWTVADRRNQAQPTTTLRRTATTTRMATF